MPKWPLHYTHLRHIHGAVEVSANMNILFVIFSLPNQQITENVKTDSIKDYKKRCVADNVTAAAFKCGTDRKNRECLFCHLFCVKYSESLLQIDVGSKRSVTQQLKVTLDLHLKEMFVYFLWKRCPLTHRDIATAKKVMLFCLENVIYEDSYP